MPCRARLTATLEHSPSGAQCLTLHSEGNEEARVIIVRAEDPATGKDWTWMIEKPNVRRLAPGDTLGLEIGDGSGPTDLVVTITWVDNAGIPGTFSMPLKRGRETPRP